MTSRPATLVAAITALLLVGAIDAAGAMTTPTPTAPACSGARTATATPSPLATRASTPPAPSGSLLLQRVTDIPLPGSASRFDYQSFDESSSRLYLAHMGADQVVVFDTTAQQVVGTVGGLKTPTGVLAVPELNRLFVAAAGSHDVAVIDTESLRVVAHTGQIDFPDGLDYVPAVKQVFVSDESGGGELVIDATTNEVVTTIDIDGEAGNTHYDSSSGCILVAVQNQNQLAVIDPATDRLVGRYDLDADCQSPHGFLIDAPRRQAFVTCEDNATLLVVDLPTLAVTATYHVGDGPDVLAFDPGWRRLYVASEAGVVSVFDEGEQGLTPIGEYEAPHAHSVSVDPATHRVYLPLENVDGKPVLRIIELVAREDLAAAQRIISLGRDGEVLAPSRVVRGADMPRVRPD
jgi:DNA-binding beta-propeller fold protein YncE